MNDKPVKQKRPPTKRVKVHYTGRLEDGTEFDTSRGKDPLTVPIGQKRVIVGFEEAIRDLAAGEKTEVTIPPKKAYGPYRDSLVNEVERSRFSDELDLHVGKTLTLKSPEGVVIAARVKELNGDKVTLDGNHPLAGKTLIFNIEVLEIL